MGPTPKQNIYVHVPGCDQQCIPIPWRYDSVTVCEAYPKRAMSDNLLRREIRCFNVKIAFHDLKIRRYASKEVVSCVICQITKAQYLSDLAGSQEFLKLQSEVLVWSDIYRGTFIRSSVWKTNLCRYVLQSC